MGKTNKQNNEKFKGVLMTYHELGSNMLHQTMNMIRHSEGLDLGAMSRINLLYKGFIKCANEMSDKYIETIQKPYYAELKAASIDWEEGQEPPDLDEEQMKVFLAIKDKNVEAIKEFEKLTTYVDAIPLAPQHLAGIKTMSPARLDSLAGLYDAEGVVRQKALGGKLGVR